MSTLNLTELPSSAAQNALQAAELGNSAILVVRA